MAIHYSTYLVKLIFLPLAFSPSVLSAYVSLRSSVPVQLGLLENFPDPTLYYDHGSSNWYMLATNDASVVLPTLEVPYVNTTFHRHIQLATSPDFKSWTLEDSSPLPFLGEWVIQGGSPIPTARVWAPDLIQHPSTGTYILYYSAASSADAGVHCIGAATAATPRGPFQPFSTPLACPSTFGGAIDPAAFIDPADNAFYVAYKIDGNILGNGGECGNTIAPLASTPIILQRMQSDGVSPDLSSPPYLLLDRGPEDGPLIEAPSLAKVGNTYFLFYSSGCTQANDYTVRYATAPAVFGPYKRAERPLLRTGDYGLTSPGSVSVRFASGVGLGERVSGVGEEEGWRMVFHARVNTAAGGVRALFTVGLHFNEEKKLVELVEGSPKAL